MKIYMYRNIFLGPNFKLVNGLFEVLKVKQNIKGQQTIHVHLQAMRVNMKTMYREKQAC